MEETNREKIESEITKCTVNGELTCDDALNLADKFNIEPLLVGKSADKLKIKIRSCKLGCFK